MLHRVIYRKVNKTQPWLETGKVVGKSVAHTRNFPRGRHIKCQVNGRDHTHSRIQVEGCLGWSKRASFWKYLGAQHRKNCLKQSFQSVSQVGFTKSVFYPQVNAPAANWNSQHTSRGIGECSGRENSPATRAEQSTMFLNVHTPQGYVGSASC